MTVENGKLTFTVGASAVSARRLVKLSSGTVIHNTATSSDEPIGVSEYGEAVGALVAVRLLADPGEFEIEAAGAITSGADVYAAADGKVQALPTAAGTYLRIGVALEAATSAGQIIRVLPYNYHSTETVTE